MASRPSKAAELPAESDITIVGAGPVGLMLANILGMYGVRCTVLEARDELIDYPRGVGLDDESLRGFQAVGLIDGVMPHITPNQIMRIMNRAGRVLAEISPGKEQFGWPRRNGFVQPAVDEELLAGVGRYKTVGVHWSHEALSFREEGDHVSVETKLLDGTIRTLTTRFLVGCDGGRSEIRKQMGVEFGGSTSPTRWLVIDIDGDPLGNPNSYVFADPRRPYVSVSVAHGIRRFEFMVLSRETDAEVEDPAFVRQLLSKVLPDPEAVAILRRRVYTHHSRIASSFRKGRVFIAGDAAHLMPVWQGQGYNSGIRDAINLGWKLAAVVHEQAGEELLETYDSERRAHARAMIDLSTAVGRMVGITIPPLAAVRDFLAVAASLIPPLKASIVEMRYKPMPRYVNGGVLHEGSVLRKNSPVGRLFMQPRVDTRTRSGVLLDEVLGTWFSVVCWNNNPRMVLDPAALAIWDGLGARFIELRPLSQLRWKGHDQPGVEIVGDRDGSLKSWFDTHDESVLFLRPDRFVAAAGIAQRASGLTRELAEALALTTDPQRNSIPTTALA